MKIKAVQKKTGYSVGIGELNKLEQTKIKKLKLPIGTYQIENFWDCQIGIWWNPVKNDYDCEKSLWFATFEPAYQLAKERGELAIWDWQNQREIWLVQKKNGKLLFHFKSKKFQFWIYEKK
ncbi:MAG: hypothetical protein I3274_07410 [Candidatus Moeniiplasma glomeromycotorum]|nr:hypothetical protein [Candidatus Moeniiplasma glomeromycotorum]